MTPDPSIAEFLERALAAGIPQQSLVAVLTAHGWSEKDVYNALADHYKGLIGVAVPRRTGAAASAREAFFYLLIFATLATWTIGFGYLCSALIDRWIADPLFTGYPQTSYTIASSLAAILVAFPLHLFVSRTLARDSAANREKLPSATRKWLTYMALVIAAGVFMGDLITALTLLLRGEMTARFLTKTFVVLALSGGVFSYYFGGIRRTEESRAKPSRDKLVATATSVVVVLAVVLGFMQLGPPDTQRMFRADRQRVLDLYQLSTQIMMAWNKNAGQFPPSLDQLSATAQTDPVSHAPYEYHPGRGSHYELCATFARSSEPREVGPGLDTWVHPAGHYCFKLDATSTSPSPPMNYPAD